MVVRKHGYKFTEVDGASLKIKERYEGTDLSSAARRLCTRSDVIGVGVEYDGEVRVHVGARDVKRNASDYVPMSHELTTC
jgi:hypothetical protein